MTSNHLCRTVGELLTSIAYLIERGETQVALHQARDCAADPNIAAIALPDPDATENLHQNVPSDQ